MNEGSSFEGRQQMMEIEIKFGKGKLDFVIVHYGDDPVMLAKVCSVFYSLFPRSMPVSDRILLLNIV
jgi:hypothetical protein